MCPRIRPPQVDAGVQPHEHWSDEFLRAEARAEAEEAGPPPDDWKPEDPNKKKKKDGE